MQKERNMTIKMPPGWLESVVNLLNDLAGKGIFIEGRDDPAELMMSLSAYNGFANDDDPWQEILDRL